ncbi:hypothetical protein Cgig2_004005 [Carnegiea gigantea]|uniref:Uncharacterized protein n=1 Tax=Carnegiea gigantea TaxID=171969 RepID=A0A9Q1KAI6_9CARY|nr:hypothetical protein Cgig2_004005 [Carnegiea gigantea]
MPTGVARWSLKICCCTTNTDVFALKSIETKKSPITPNSGLSLQSDKPSNIIGFIPCFLPTIHMSIGMASFNDCTAEMVSSPVLTTTSLYTTLSFFSFFTQNHVTTPSSNFLSDSTSPLYSFAKNRITIRDTSERATIRSAKERASRASGPPMKSMAN